MRVFQILGGALLGFVLAFQGKGWLGVSVGAFIGFATAEFIIWRSRIARLENEVAELQRRLAARDADAPTFANTAAASAPPAEPRTAAAPGTPRTEGATQSAPSAPRGETAAATEAAPSGPSLSRAAARTGAAASEAATLSPAPSTSSGPTRPAPTLSPADGAMASSGYGTGGYSPPRPQEHASAAAETSWQPPPPREDPALIRAIRDYFTGGNTLARVGIIILFIGVAFLLRYVAEHTYVPIQLRLSGVAAIGIVLLVLGWRLRAKRPGYALALQGGAIGILYLTVFAALRLFHIMPPGPAFAVLVVLSALCASLAVLQDSMAFALLAIGCGFLAPVLASSGQGNHVMLFSYYAVLNLGILAIAWFKAWRPLNVVGFLFTFVIGTAWGVLRYREGLFASTEPFLVGFFLLYIVIAVLFSVRQRPVLNGYVDGTIVFGTPVVAFSLQSGMVHHWEFALAYSALVVSALYLVLAWLLFRGKRDTQRLLVEAFLALGIAFLTLAVPLALDGRWSASTWALEGAALVWIGCRQGRKLSRAAGALLQIASGLIFLADVSAPYSDVPVLNSACLGGVMIAVGSVFACRELIKARERLAYYESPFAAILFFWGMLWWLIAGTTEIGRHVADEYVAAALLVFLSATALISSELHRRLDIGVARLPPFALLPVMVIFAAVALMRSSHPFADAGWVAWPIAFALFYWLCRRQEKENAATMANARVANPAVANAAVATEAAASAGVVRALHVGSALLLVVLLSWELAWQVNEGVDGRGSWLAIAYVLIPAIALWVLPRLCTRIAWPFGAHRETYIAVVGSVLATYLTVWTLGTNLTLPGDPYPLPYVPLLNFLDLAEVFVLLVLLRHGRHISVTRYPSLAGLDARALIWTMAVLVFVWLNAVLLRTLHHWAGVPFELEAMFRSPLVQAGLAIFWGVLALATMFFASRKSTSIVWYTGLALLILVDAKLVLIDFSRGGSVERIVSFIGVGVLTLVIAYVAPRPNEQRVAA
jgi:uncharacterized membrane protein